MNPDVDRIVSATADLFGVSAAALRGRSRSKSIMEARLAAYYVARHCTRLSYPELGRELGRDHSSVLSGVTRMRECSAGDAFLAKALGILIAEFGGERRENGP